MAAPAMRLSGQCPDCNAKLVRRERKADREPFVSCSAYPKCKFSESWDPHLNEIARQIAELQAEVSQLKRIVNDKGGRVPSRDLREVIAYAHPDRWPNSAELAHGVTSRLNAIREAL